MRRDTDFVDLAAIEGIALFCPQVYHSIQEEPDLFRGTWGYLDREQDSKALKQRYDKIFDRVPEDRRHSVLSLCEFLFPRMRYVASSNRTTYGSEWDSQWQKARRIASRKFFPYYFSAGHPDTDVSRAQIDRALEHASAVPDFVRVLAEFKTSNRFARSLTA